MHRVALSEDKLTELKDKCKCAEDIYTLYDPRRTRIRLGLDRAKEAHIGTSKDTTTDGEDISSRSWDAWTSYRNALDKMFVHNDNARGACSAWRRRELSDRDTLALVNADWPRQPNQLSENNRLVVNMKQKESRAVELFDKLTKEFEILEKRN